MSDQLLNFDNLKFRGNQDFISYVFDRYVRPCGFWQLFFTVMVALSSAPYEFITIYTLGRPDVRCKMEPNVESILENVTFSMASQLLQPSINLKNFPSGNVGCLRMKQNWTEVDSSLLDGPIANNFNITYESCPHGYVTQPNELQMSWTAVDEFGLFCDRNWLSVFSVTIFMVGTLVGFYLAGWSGDRFGRRICMIVYSLLELGLGLVYAFSPNIIIYMILRFLLGIITTCKMSLYSLMIFEYTSHKYRGILSSISNIVFAFMSKSYVALFAYLASDWRLLIGLTCIMVAIGVVLIPIYYESPFFLASVNKPEEACKSLESAYRINHFGKRMSSYDSMKVRNFLENIIEQENKASLAISAPSSGITELFTDFEMLKRLVLGSLLFAFHINVYYGLYLYGGEIKYSIYLIGFINSISAVPGSILAIIQMRKFKDLKWPLMLNFSITGIILIGVVTYTLIMKPEKDTVLSVTVSIGMCFMESSMVIMYVYIMDLFPTLLRSKGFGFSSGFARLGSMATGAINNMDRYVLHGSPILVYIAVLGAAIFILFLMPRVEHEEDVESEPDYKHVESKM